MFYLAYIRFAKENYEIYEDVPPTYVYEPPIVEVMLDKKAHVDTIIMINVLNTSTASGEL